MNGTIDENVSHGFKSKIKKHSQFKTKLTPFQKPVLMKNTKIITQNNIQTKNLELSKIIKLSGSLNPNLKIINVDFCKNSKLLEKLFEMKSKMKIKKKTFI